MPPDELPEAIQAALQRLDNWSIEPEWIVWLPGLVCGLNVACRAVGRDGDDVLTTVPVYPPFLSAPGHMHRKLVAAPMVLEGGQWAFDFDRLAEAVTPQTRLLLLCNPHNPLGRAYTREELAAVGEICTRHDIIICSDEIHAGLVLDEDKRHIPIASLSPEIAATTITLRAPSKTFNLPGLGCSYGVISDRRLRTAFKKAMAGIVPHINVFGYTAALAAYQHGQEWHAALLDYLRGNRDLLEREVAQMPGLSMTHVEATYLAWVNARDAGIGHPAQFFEEAGLGLSDGKDFAGRGYVRLNFGCPRALLSEALGRMKAAMQRQSR